MFLVGYLAVEVVSFCAANSSCLLALGAGYQQGWGTEGAESSEIDEVGFWWKLSWEVVLFCEAGERRSSCFIGQWKHDHDFFFHGRSQPGLGDDVVIFFFF